MNISHLYEYVTLAKYMNLTSAARELYISPSTLSQHITGIENELNTRLFDRKSTLILTKDGAMALDHFQKILDEYEFVKAKCAETDEKEAIIRVPSYFFGQDLYLAAKDALKRQHPECNITIQTFEYQLKDPFDILNDDMCDIAALYLAQGSGESVDDYLLEDMEYIHLGALRHALVSSKDHPYAKKSKTKLTRDDLQNQVFLTSLSRLNEIHTEGIKKKLQGDGVNISIRYRRINRHEDMFGLDMDDGLLLSTEGWREFEYFSKSPNVVTYKLEPEVLSDAYLLYKPASLSKLQRMYIDTLRNVAELRSSLFL